jgi:integrase/recombinase XerD
MIKQIIEAAIRTGARQEELLSARREQVDHERRQLTLFGKRGKVRVIDLEPFDGYELFQSLPVYMGKPSLFWHSEGQNYRTFASQFLKIVVATGKWAAANGVEFRRFRFHDLRHLHAVEWLKSGRSIYDLQRRLGHTSVKTTEGYCIYLTAEEERVAKAGDEVAQKGAQIPMHGTRRV